VPTLDEIRDALLPDAARVAGTSGERRAPDVAWVRVLRARVPALDVLEPGDVVIVPVAALPVVAPSDEQQQQLVATLAGAGVAGLLLVDVDVELDVDGDEAPAGSTHEALVAAAIAHGVATYRIARLDPGTLERRLIGYLVDRRGELERQAAGLEADLARLAMSGHGLEALAGAIGGFLRRAVALEGHRGDALAVHAPADVPDAAAAVAGYLARPPVAGRRVALPGPAGEGTPAGWLVVLGDRPMSELETVVAERIAPLLALELVTSASGGRGGEGRRRAEAMPTEGPPWIVLVARQQDGSGDGIGTPDELRRELRVRFPARRLALRGTSESLELRAIAAPDPDDARGLAMAGQIAGLLGRTVGLSRPFTDPARRASEEAAARGALEAAERLMSVPSVARADRLSAYRLLASLGSLPDGRAQALALLEPLLVGRPAAARERTATLRALLDHGGVGEAAAVLGVHRNTVAYRQRAIEAATGWDLADPDLRLSLAIALRIMQSAQ
jgi:hypothetical protein